ncbi:MAG: hypothetical protein NW226_26905 [Microscillaceae bacterium]|nr:hypothetical protein [Microscillaceae bacterium]
MGLREEFEKVMKNADQVIKNSQKLREEANKEFEKILGDRYQKYSSDRDRKK